jgi:hypothetical protein
MPAVGRRIAGMRHLGEMLMNRGIFGENSDNDIRVEENATTH